MHLNRIIFSNNFKKDLYTLRNDDKIDDSNITHIFKALKKSGDLTEFKGKMDRNPKLDKRQIKLIKFCADRATKKTEKAFQTKYDTKEVTRVNEVYYRRLAIGERSPFESQNPKIKGLNLVNFSNKLEEYGKRNKKINSDSIKYVVVAALDAKDRKEFENKLYGYIVSEFVTSSVYGEEVKESILQLLNESIER